MEHNIIFVLAVFSLAGAVKGVTGMGLPTVAMALLSLAMTPVEAAGLLVVPSLLTNLWQLLSGPPLYAMWQRLWPMTIGICGGTLIGSVVMRQNVAATIMLGLALAAYAAVGLSSLRWQVARENEEWMSPLAGALTGLFTAAAGVFVLPAVPYLQSLKMDKDELVQAMGLAFTVSTVALAVALAARGAWEPAVAGTSFLAQLPAIAGMLLGQKLRDRMPQETFRRCLMVVLLLLGVYLCLGRA